MQKKKLTKQQLDFKVLMFSYGSNMLQERLENRVGPVSNYGKYELTGYELIFDCGTSLTSFANIRAKEDSVVEGVIYELTYKQLRQLDYYESLYERYTRVLGEPFEGRKLHFYISPFRRAEFAKPLDRSYYNAIMRGAIRNNCTKVVAHMMFISEHIKSTFAEFFKF